MWRTEWHWGYAQPCGGKDLKYICVVTVLHCSHSGNTHSILDFSACVVYVCMNICMHVYHVCLCIWKSEGSIGYLPQSLSTIMDSNILEPIVSKVALAMVFHHGNRKVSTTQGHILGENWPSLGS